MPPVKKLREKTLNVMGFFDEFEKDEIKKKTDLAVLFQSFGVNLTKKGKSYIAKCPWHDDSTPSLSIDNEKGLYNCFGCDESGDVFTLVEKMKGYSFREAIEYLKNPSFTRTSSSVIAPTIIPESTTVISESQTLNDAVNWYAKKLHEKKEARAYLAQRGLDDAKLITRFRIGYCDGSLLSVIGESQKKDLIENKILNEKDGRLWEHFKNCITFPIVDELDRVLGIYGRRVELSESSNNMQSTDAPKHFYLKGFHKGIFNRRSSTVYKEIILTECIIDALSLIKLGFENVQSIYGTNGFTDEHMQILKDDRVKSVILALDNDKPGRLSTEKLKTKLIEEGFSVKVINPDVKDWNEYLTTSTDLAESEAKVKELIEKAVAEQSESEVPAPDKAPVPNKFFTVKKESGNYFFEIESLQYRISGVKDFFAVNLKVNIKVTISETETSLYKDRVSHYDSIDLYSARSRASFSAALSKNINVESAKIEKNLILILEHLETERDNALSCSGSCETDKLTEEETQLGLSFLQSPTIFETIINDMDALGYVGENLNKLLLYIAASSRKLDDPISVLILSESASGKSMLMDTVAKLMPEEDVVSATSLSEQALNYIDNLMHKFVTLGEIVHSEAVDHQIREMLSGKELSRLVTVKDEKTGKMSAKLVKTPAVVSLVMSGTSYNINPENASRCFLVNTDESREQTRRIHERQREKYTLDRYKAKKETNPDIIRKHQCAQRMLRKIAIINLPAKYLDFPDMQMRTRRDHDRFIDLIVCCAHLRQFQKEIKYSGTEYIECDIEDYRAAYQLMVNGVLSSTMRELPKSVIEFYDMLRNMARETAKKNNLEIHEVSFTQREIREYSGYGNTWVKKNMRTLIEYEYALNDKATRARSKGFYRIKNDEPIGALDFSMIPSPEKMEELLKEQSLE